MIQLVRLGEAVLAGLILGIATIPCDPATAQDGTAFVDIGRLEYEENCAACHGPEGNGDGPVAEVLSTKPPDLTQITSSYSGTFPRDQIFKVIDGRNMINPHGDRQMPVWGTRFMTRAQEQSAASPRDVDAAAIVLGRTTALVDYLASIQSE
jgi:mono/diheme cytochrome c family protein